MAVIPTLWHIGNDQLNGTAPTPLNVPAVSNYNVWRNTPLLLEPVPSSPTGKIQTVPSYYPFWDGAFAGSTGGWLVYHHIPGAVPGSLGGSWYAAGAGMGSDAMYMQLLKQDVVFGVSPGFRVFKMAQGGGITNGFKVGGGAIAAIYTEWTTKALPQAGAGNTLDVRGIVVDASSYDIQNWASAAASYETNLRGLIADLRTHTSSTTKIFLVTHAPELYQISSPGAAVAVRGIHYAISRDTAGVYLVDMAGATFGAPDQLIGSAAPVGQVEGGHNATGGAVGTLVRTGAGWVTDEFKGAYVRKESGTGTGEVRKITGNTTDTLSVTPNWGSAPTTATGYSIHFEPSYYDTESILNQGVRIYRAFKASETTIVPVVGGGFPIYAVIGDSQGVGRLSPVYLVLSGQASIIGTGPGTVRSNQYVWNDLASQWQLFDPLLNSNTAGSITANSGPIVTITAELAKKHPNGFGIIQMCVNGSAVSASLAAPYTPTFGGRWKKGANEHYQVFLAMARRAFAAAFEQADMRKIPDLRGVIMFLGDNDTYSAQDGAAFLPELRNLIADFRADFTTRTGGKDLPVAIHRVAAVSSLGVPAGRSAVHGAPQTLAAEDSQFTWVNADDIELQRDDNVHYGSEGTFTIGRRVVAGLNDIDLDSGGGSGGSSAAGADGASFAGGSSGDSGAGDAVAAAATGASATSASSAGLSVDALEAAMAQSPDVASFTVDGQTTVRRSMRDMIDGIEYLRARDAARNGLRQTQVGFD